MFSGCEYFDEDTTTYNPNDARARAIGGSVTSALESLGASGPEFFYGAMARSVKEICTEEQFVSDFEGIPEQMRLRYVNDIDFQEDGTADVELTLITPDGDVDQEWRMENTTGPGWAILAIPGLEECAIRADGG
jgi:hypothetical protein